MEIDGYAFITGAGSGIGRQCALAYTKEGASGVAIADINFQTACKVAEECKNIAVKENFRVIPLAIDVRKEQSVEEAIITTLKQFGRIDYGVNCAGIGVQNPAEVSAASPTEFDEFMKVNVTGTLLVVRQLSKIMKVQEKLKGDSTNRKLVRGTIILLGSANSLVATQQIVQYVASKHAVLGISRTAALDNARYGIRVNCLCPGWVQGPMMEKAIVGNNTLEEFIKSAVPLRRMAYPEEVSDVVMFLSSPRSSYVTGAAWVVDGGTTIQVQTGV